MNYQFPPFLLWISLVVSGGATFYYGAIVGGLYKDSMMAHLRKYGEERLALPICRFLNVLGVCCLAAALSIPTAFTPTSYVYRLLPPTVFVVLALIAFGASLAAQQHPAMREALPRCLRLAAHPPTAALAAQRRSAGLPRLGGPGAPDGHLRCI
jgi:uncharacterized membrane protein